jgi:hypothetical protein
MDHTRQAMTTALDAQTAESCTPRNRISPSAALWGAVLPGSELQDGHANAGGTAAEGDKPGAADDRHGAQGIRDRIRPRRSTPFRGVLNDKELADRAWPSSSNGSDSSSRPPPPNPIRGHGDRHYHNL